MFTCTNYKQQIIDYKSNDYCYHYYFLFMYKTIMIIESSIILQGLDNIWTLHLTYHLLIDSLSTINISSFCSSFFLLTLQSYLLVSVLFHSEVDGVADPMLNPPPLLRLRIDSNLRTATDRVKFSFY